MEGFSRSAFAAEFGEDPSDRFAKAVEQGIANGLLEIHEDLIRLSAEGRLLANEVLVAFLPEAGTGQDGAPLRELATAR